MDRSYKYFDLIIALFVSMLLISKHRLGSQDREPEAAGADFRRRHAAKTKHGGLKMQRKQSSLYPYMMAAFAVVLVLSNTVATKLCPFGPFVWTAAILLFPVAYILGDVITEVYGYAGARRIFWVGLAANLGMALTYTMAIKLPALNPEFNQMFSTVLAQVPRIVIASMVGVWCGQFANAFVMSKMKVLTEGKWLWTRTITSTLVGETVDTAVFATLGFAFVVPWAVVGQMVYSAALFKTLYEATVTPLTYIVVNAVKRHEGEVFDHEVNYNPFVREVTHG